jgi:hypothetical protein
VSLSSVFAESFADGFTMAGFMKRLRRPGSATQMFASAPSIAGPTSSAAEWNHLTFVPANSEGREVNVAGNLRRVPEQALHAMMDLLKKEDEDRKAARSDTERAVHGTSR